LLNGPTNVLQIGNKGEAIRKCKNKLAAIANYISRLSLATSASNVEGKAYKRYIIMFHGGIIDNFYKNERSL